MSHLIVQVNRVPHDPVLQEGFSMIGGHHDNGVIRAAQAIQLVQQTPHLLIGEQDLAGILPLQPGNPLRGQGGGMMTRSRERGDVVALTRSRRPPGLEANGVRHRRIVIVVNIPEVHVEKNRLVPVATQKFDGMTDGPGAGYVAMSLGGEDEVVEAPVKAEVIRQGQSRHDGCRAISRLLEALCQCWDRSIQRPVVEIHMVGPRRETREECHDRRGGPGGRGTGLAEACRLRRQCIQARAEIPRVTGVMQMIRPQGIDDHDHHRRRPFPRPAGGGRHQENREPQRGRMALAARE
ncbi:MAG: hypothetical protein O7C74_01995 [Acidobacteria bacterium]|nr:hypothetical protein [Acidobacteriota bacterium]